VNSAADRFTTWDAAYVLGSLSPAERREFEEHLAGCPACQAAVSELAGMPGMLAQVPPEDAALLAAAPPEVVAPPPDMLAAIRSRQASRRRRMVAFLGGGAAAVLLVLAGIGYALGLLPLGPRGPQHLAFETVAPTAMTAVVDVIPVDNGTDLEVRCSYAESNEPEPGGAYATYSIYVIDRSGNASMVKKWPAKPNRTMTPSGHTDLKIRQIEAVEIRISNTDQTVLRAVLR
jgi:Putative zinc-finger